MKELNDMSDEELWTLFPILLTEHQENWKDLYIQEEEQLRAFVGESIFRIRHIGHIIRDKRSYRHRSLYQKD